MQLYKRKDLWIGISISPMVDENFSLTDHVLVTVVNSIAGLNARSYSLDSDLKEENDALYVEVSAMAGLRSTRGNKYKNRDLIKEAFLSSQVKKVHQAYGKVGINFNTHTAFNRLDLDNPLNRNDNVTPGDEIVLIENQIVRSILKATIARSIKQHRIIPDRKN